MTLLIPGAAIIIHQMRLFIVDGIKYERIGEDFFYAQELFEQTGRINKWC